MSDEDLLEGPVGLEIHFRLEVVEDLVGVCDCECCV